MVIPSSSTPLRLLAAAALLPEQLVRAIAQEAGVVHRLARRLAPQRAGDEVAVFSVAEPRNVYGPRRPEFGHDQILDQAAVEIGARVAPLLKGGEGVVAEFVV